MSERYYISIFHICTLFILLLTSSFSQDNPQSSLREITDLASELRKSNPDSAILLANQALDLARNGNDSTNLVHNFRLKGLIKYDQRDLDSAHLYFLQAYAIAEKIDYLKERLWISMGNVAYQKKDWVGAQEMYEKALQLRQASDTVLWMDALNNLGSVHLNQREYDDAIGYYKRGLSLQKSIDDEKAQIPTLFNLGYAFSKLNELDSAIQSFNKSHALSLKHDRVSFAAHVLEQLGLVYSSSSQYFESQKTYLRALQLWDSLSNEPKRANLLMRIGVTFNRSGDYDQSLNYYKRALTIYQTLKDTGNVARVLNSIGKNYNEIEQFDTARHILLEALRLYEKSGKTGSMTFPMYNLGHGYLKTGLLDSAAQYINAATQHVNHVELDQLNLLITLDLGELNYRRGDLGLSLKFATDAVNQASALGYRAELSNAYKLLYELYKAMNQSGQALAMLEAHKSLQDSIFTQSSARKIARIEAEYQYNQERKVLEEKNLREKTMLAAKIRRQRFVLFSLVGLVTLITMLWLMNRRIERLKRNALLEEERFKNQINEQQLRFERREKEKLEELNELKSTFFANISHELKTPLTLILTPIQNLLKRNKLDKDDLASAQFVLQSAQNLHQRINEILDLTKLEANEMELKPVPTNIYLFIKQLTSMFESLTEQKKQQLLLEYKLDKNLQLLIDQRKFEHVFNNFLSNATKYTPKRGKIQVTLSKDTSDQNEILLTVKDNGPGIAKDELPRVFDRFFQSENRPGVEGSGIGLALCKEIAALMGGEVDVDSDLGVGSVFQFKMPVKEYTGEITAHQTSYLQKQVNIINEQVEHGFSSKKSTILLVEDNLELRTFIQILLSDKFNVLTAENGQMALERLETLQADTDSRFPDLILSDIMMPVMDGFQLLENLKGSDQWRQIPVIMLTALSQTKTKLKALRIGVDDYLLKPFQEEELIARIDNLLKNVNNRNQKVLEDEGEVVKTATFTPSDSKWLEKVEHMLIQEIGNSAFNIDILAERQLMSRRQLHRRIKTITGLTPNQYFRAIKLQTAREHLERGNFRTVSEVAYAVGFESSKYFSKLFKECFGKKPSSYFKQGA